MPDALGTLVGRAFRPPTPACGDLAPRPGATAAKLPPSQRRPAPLAERLERGLFKLRRDLDLAHLGGEASRPLPLALPTINSDLEFVLLGAPKPAIVSPVAASAPVRLGCPFAVPLSFGVRLEGIAAVPPRPQLIACTATAAAFACRRPRRSPRLNSVGIRHRPRHGRKTHWNCAWPRSSPASGALARPGGHRIHRAGVARERVNHRLVQCHHRHRCPCVFAGAVCMHLEGSAVGTLRPRARRSVLPCTSLGHWQTHHVREPSHCAGGLGSAGQSFAPVSRLMGGHRKRHGPCASV